MVSSTETPVPGTTRPSLPGTATFSEEHRGIGRQSVAPGTGGIVGGALSAFVVVFLFTGFVLGSLRGDGWISAIGSAASLGTVAAGIQLMLVAVRGRRELEGPTVVEDSSLA